MCIYIHEYICVYTYMHTYIYVYIHIHVYVYTLKLKILPGLPGYNNYPGPIAMNNLPTLQPAILHKIHYSLLYSYYQHKNLCYIYGGMKLEL